MTQMKNACGAPDPLGPLFPCRPWPPVTGRSGTISPALHQRGRAGSSILPTVGRITTSEGQSYGLFFRPGPSDDRETFARLLGLDRAGARPRRSDRLPAVLALGTAGGRQLGRAGRKQRLRLGSLDSLHSLLEAGRLRTTTATRPLVPLLLRRIAWEEGWPAPVLGQCCCPCEGYGGRDAGP